MATNGVRAPGELDFANARERWPEWKKKFLRYRAVVGLCDKDESQQIDTLVYIMGDEAEGICEQLVYSEGKTDKKFDDVVEAFERHFMPRSNFLHYRVQFHGRDQKSDETVEAYIQELHQLAAKCEFTDKAGMLRDRLLCGMADKQLACNVHTVSNCNGTWRGTVGGE